MYVAQAEQQPHGRDLVMSLQRPAEQTLEAICRRLEFNLPRGCHGLRELRTLAHARVVPPTRHLDPTSDQLEGDVPSNQALGHPAGCERFGERTFVTELFGEGNGRPSMADG